MRGYGGLVMSMALPGVKKGMQPSMCLASGELSELLNSFWNIIVVVKRDIALEPLAVDHQMNVVSGVESTIH